MHTIMKRATIGLVCAFSFAAIPAIALAQKPQPRAPALAAQGNVVPKAEALLMMIRTTLIALNHANRTGNYTVLRDLAAPSFQATNNPARLGQIFAKLRGKNLDLSPIVLVSPKLLAKPAITAQGMLHIRGLFPTRPLQINFELLFQPVAGHWRLFGLSVKEGQAPKKAKRNRKSKP